MGGGPRKSSMKKAKLPTGPEQTSITTKQAHHTSEFALESGVLKPKGREELHARRAEVPIAPCIPAQADCRFQGVCVYIYIYTIYTIYTCTHIICIYICIGSAWHCYLNPTPAPVAGSLNTQHSGRLKSS